MKFAIGETIIRFRRKEPRTVLRYENNGYVLSDSKNGFGEVWINKFIVEEQFKRCGQ